jgi:hypothetical protein
VCYAYKLHLDFALGHIIDRSMARSCQFCRRRKIKCDALRPVCATCSSGNRECVYDNTPRKQRPTAALVSSLQGEKAALEEVLGQLKTADDEKRHALLDSITIHGGSVSVSHRASTSFSTTSPEARSVSTSQQQFEPLDHDQQQSYHPPAPDVPPPGHHAAYEELQDDVISQVVDDRNGHTVPADGDYGTKIVNYSGIASVDSLPGDNMYSSTSVIRLSSPVQAMSFDDQGHKTPAVSEQTLRYQLIANATMERQHEHQLRHLSTIRGVPAGLALHLLDLHWCRQHHTFLLTYRPAFMRELVDGGPYCSDLLLYAVFACSSKFSERLEVRSDPADPQTAGQHFFTRCDELLLHGGLLSQSRIPTIIALVMLGSTFNGRGLTSKAWLYTGYAIRMVYDLGLHLDSVQPNTHNAEEVEIRRRVFWGAFICEKIQSLYLARPPTIGLRDARVSLNLLDTFEELELWEPYQDPQAAGTTPPYFPPVCPANPPFCYSVSVFQQLCHLSKLMTQVMNKIYFVGATTKTVFSDVQPLDEDLTAWYRNLPGHLLFEPWTKSPMDSPIVVAPNRIILLTTYHSLVVLLHRPFVTSSNNGASTQTHSNSNRSSVNSHRLDHPESSISAHSWKRCTTAARNITNLTLSYRSIYPLRRSSYLLSYAVYVACTIHVLNAASVSASSENHSYAESSLLLSASLRCLDELAVPNSGVADTARIIRKLMAAKGVQESASKF